MTPEERRERQRARDCARDSTPERHDYNRARATAFRESPEGRAYFASYREANRAATRLKAALRPVVRRRVLAALRLSTD